METAPSPSGLGRLALLACLAAVPAQPQLDVAACRGLPLAHAEEDQRDRAGRDLYAKCDRAVLKDPAVAGKLLEHVRKGSAAAGPIVLLGYLSRPEARKELERLSQSNQPVKLQPWTGVVPASLPATLALARLDGAGTRKRLEALARDKSLVLREFLLDVSRDLPDSQVRLLTPYLDDLREIRSGVPSHASPQRRLADAALVALARRLNLKLGFELDDARRYTDEERRAAKAAIAAALR